MLTIKEFAKLCGCNAQTLRYYDRVGLLKPRRVDEWTGYRYYAEAQAVDFVKIKNLQSADFRIGEIKALLVRSDREVCEALAQKAAEQRQKLERILQIQQTYLEEKMAMEQIVQGLAGFLLSQVTDYEGLREFGLEPADGGEIMDLVRTYLEKELENGVPAGQEPRLSVDGEVARGAENVLERVNALGQGDLDKTILLGDEADAERDEFDPNGANVLYERHGWQHAAEWIASLPALEAGGQYRFVFRLADGKRADELWFPLFFLGAMLRDKNGTEANMGCKIDESADGLNHFIMLQKA